MELELSAARFDLTVEAFPHEGALDVYFDYNCDLYDEGDDRSAAGALAVDSGSGDSGSQSGYRRDSTAFAREREKLLFDWNRTEAPIPAGRCFHHRFAEFAQESIPSRVALMANDEGVTYGELNTRADRIAAALRKRGAAPARLVGVFLPRGADLVSGPARRSQIRRGVCAS